jgi:hypothetical protein
MQEIPKNIELARRALEELLPELPSPLTYGLNYEEINFFGSHIQKPPKEEFEAKLQELIDAQPLRELREARDKILSTTDKYATIDYPHATDEEKQARLAYRQTLRDLPSMVTSSEGSLKVWVTNQDVDTLKIGDTLSTSNTPGYFTKGEPILMKMSETCDFSESRTEVHYTANVVYIQSSHTANVTVNDEWDDIVVTPNGITYAQWSNLDANVQNTYTFIYASELEQDPQYATRIEEPAVTYAEWSNLDANTQNTYTLTYMQVNDVHYEKTLTSNVTESDPWDSIYIDPPNVSYTEYSNLEANVQNTYTLTYTMTVKTKATEAVYSNLSAEDKLYFTPVYTRTKNEIVTEGTQGAVKHTTIIPNEIKYLDASGTETDASNAVITAARVRCTFAAQ